MIGYLQGEVLDCSEGRLLLGVGDKAWGTVGYAVAVPQGPDYLSIHEGQKLELHIYTHVREESFDLYGFQSKFEKNLFLTLLGVNGIGPKSALGIVSAVDPRLLIDAIIQGDRSFLTQVPGVGKKTAERVVVELKDSIQKKMELSGSGTSKKSPLEAGLPRNSLNVSALLMKESREALLGLGYREQEVFPIVDKILSGDDQVPSRVEDVIRIALRQLA